MTMTYRNNGIKEEMTFGELRRTLNGQIDTINDIENRARKLQNTPIKFIRNHSIVSKVINHLETMREEIARTLSTINAISDNDAEKCKEQALRNISFCIGPVYDDIITYDTMLNQCHY